MKQQGKRQDQIEASYKMVSLGIMGMVVMVICIHLLAIQNSGIRDVELDDYLDGTEETILDTMKAIIPKGKGIIEYSDGRVDSIRWGYTDEDLLWIGANGDTFRD
tara:strand:- start:458 stop:772 length:315 start_codon:yes stop_codon:yes gene_type:complete